MSAVTGIYLCPYTHRVCNVHEGKFNVSASNLIIFASTINQVQVNGQWKRLKGLQHNMGQHTNRICTKSSN